MEDLHQKASVMKIYKLFGMLRRRKLELSMVRLGLLLALRRKPCLLLPQRQFVCLVSQKVTKPQQPPDINQEVQD